MKEWQWSKTLDANGTTVRYGIDRYGWFTLERVEVGHDDELHRTDESAVVSVPPEEDTINQIIEGLEELR